MPSALFDLIQTPAFLADDLSPEMRAYHEQLRLDRQRQADDEMAMHRRIRQGIRER